MWHWFVALSRPLDSVRWAAAIAQVVIPIFSQKFPACLAGSLMMKCVILTNVRTLLLSFLSIHNLHISNGLHQIWKSCHILATSKTLFFSFWFNLRLIKKWQFLHRNTDSYRLCANMNHFAISSDYHFVTHILIIIRQRSVTKYIQNSIPGLFSVVLVAQVNLQMTLY